MDVTVVIAQNVTDLFHIRVFINVSKCFTKAQLSLISNYETLASIFFK